MPAKKPKSRPELDQLIAANLKRSHVELPLAAIEDLRYFGNAAKAGRAITIDGLQQYLFEKYAVQIGKHSLSTIALRNSITPWWSKK